MFKNNKYNKLIFFYFLSFTVTASSITNLATDRDFDGRIKYLAIGFSSGKIKLWDLSVPKVIASFSRNSSSIISMDMNLYSNSIAVSYSDGNVLKMDIRGNQKWSKYYPPGNNTIFSSVNISQNGKYLYFVGNDPSGIILNEGGELINYFYTNYKSSIYGLKSHLSNDNDFLLTTHTDNTIRVWSIMDSSLSLVNVNKQNRPRIIDMSTLDDRNFGNVILIADRRKRIHLYDFLSNKYIGNARTRNEPSAISFINGDNDDRSFLVGDIKGKISFWVIEGTRKIKILDESKKIHKSKIIGLIPLDRKQGSLVITSDHEAVYIIDYTNYEVKAKLFSDDNIETYNDFKIEEYF